MIHQQKNNPIKPLEDLSIQISLDGLSFLRYRSNTLDVISLEYFNFDHTSKVEKLHLACKKYFSRFSLTPKMFNNIQLSTNNDLSSFIPASLFDEEDYVSYLNKNIHLENNDFITHDELKEFDLVNVFVPYVNVNNYLLDTFGSFIYLHISTVLVHAFFQFCQDKQDTQWLVHIQKNSIQVVVVCNHKLRFYNSFPYEKSEDMLYYILLAAKNCNINPNERPIYLAGDILEGDANYQLLYTYIRSLNFLTPITPLKFNDDQISNTHRFYSLISLQQCVS